MMNKYTIYCTALQTRKALELGAPIFPIKSRRTKETVVSSDDVISYDEDFYTYVTNPTAEEMIGWLEEQGIWIHFCKPNQRPELLSFSVSNIKEPFRREFVGGEYNSRKKATLAAIDAALDYLNENKK